MSLAEKLSKLTKELETSKAISEKEAQENELKPIRTKVAALEVEKTKLELIKNSLEAKKEDDAGMGMKEYQQSVAGEEKQSYEKVKKLFEENKESLNSLGITNIDELVAYPEFQEDEEIVAYRTAKGRIAETHEADEKLKEQLQSLGIPVAEEDFTYEKATQSLEEKLHTLEEKLLHESLKLPEKRKEVIDMIAEQIEPKLYDEEYTEERGQVKQNGQTEIAVIGKLKIGGASYHRFDIQIAGDDTEYYTHREYPEKWMPSVDTMKELSEKYGQEVVDEAFEEAYREKTRTAVDLFYEKKIKQRLHPEEQDADLIHRNDLVEKLTKNILFVTNLNRLENNLELEARRIGLLSEQERISAHAIGGRISDIEKYRQNALVALPHLLQFEQSLPKEPVRFEYNSYYYRNHHVTVVSIEKRARELMTQEREIRKKNDDLESKLKELQDNGPKRFGKKKWETDVSETKQKIEATKKEANDIKEKASKVYNESIIHFPEIDDAFDSRAHIRDLLKEMDGREGSAEEVLAPLKERLAELVQTEVPKKVKELSQEYQENTGKLHAHWNE